MRYCYIYGDSADHLYLGRESALNIEFCPHCKMVLNREETILQAADTVKWRKKKFFVTTYDGKITYGVLDNGICPTCKRSKGHHYPRPYRIIEFDEQKLQKIHFIVVILNLPRGMLNRKR